MSRQSQASHLVRRQTPAPCLGERYSRHRAFIESIHHLMMSSAGSGGSSRVGDGGYLVRAALHYRGFLLMQIRSQDFKCHRDFNSTALWDARVTALWTGDWRCQAWDNVVVPGWAAAVLGLMSPPPPVRTLSHSAQSHSARCPHWETQTKQIHMISSHNK